MLSTSDLKIKSFRATEVEKNERGEIWAVWGVNVFTNRAQLWCIAELKAYNDIGEIQATVSKLISGKKG